jgi:hypothetical protein
LAVAVQRQSIEQLQCKLLPTAKWLCKTSGCLLSLLLLACTLHMPLLLPLQAEGGHAVWPQHE